MCAEFARERTRIVSRAGEDTSPLLSRNVERFQGGLVFKAHRLLYNSTLGPRVINKKKKKGGHLQAPRSRPCLAESVCEGEAVCE